MPDIVQISYCLCLGLKASEFWEDTKNTINGEYLNNFRFTDYTVFMSESTYEL